MRIEPKLITSYLLVISFIGIIGYISFDISQHDLQKSVGERQISLALEIIDSIEKSTHNKFVLFKMYVNEPLVKETVRLSNQQFEKLNDVQDYINKQDQEWITTPKDELTPFMRGLINNELAEDLRKQARTYEENFHNSIPEIFVTNSYGANIAQTQKTSDYKQDDEVWWQSAKRDGMFIGQVDYDESAAVYSNDIAISINDNGNFLGVMKIVTNFEGEIDAIKTAKKSARQNMELILIADDGTVLYSTDEIHKLGTKYGLFDKLTAADGYFIGKDPVLHKDEKLIVFAGFGGQKNDNNGLDGFLILEHEKDKILAPLTSTRNLILGASLTASIVAIIISIFIARSISNPIKKLTEAADEITQGNFDSKVRIKSNDEIGKLAESFNFMAASLKRAFGQKTTE